MDLAVCTIRPQPHYRRDAFLAGLKAAGYAIISSGTETKLKPTDLFITWNRYGGFADEAERWEKRGGMVLVCENGYCGNDSEGRQYYAIGIGGHNGSGAWPSGDGSRWAALNIEIRPWRSGGDHVVVFMQRGIGAPLMASPPNFETMVRSRLAGRTKRRIVFSAHPGQSACSVGDQTRKELEGAHAAITWASGRGVRSLIEGVPVFYLAPHWSCEGAASRDLSLIESPPMPERLPALERMAWGQWSVAEIESGLAFEAILNKVSG